MTNWISWMQNVISPLKRVKREIADQKNKLHLNQRRFEELLISGNDLICIIGADGYYQYVSPSAKQVLHFEPRYFIGKTPFEFIHPDDVARISNAFEYVLTTEEKVHITSFRFKNAYGEWCWLDSFATNRINDPAICGVVINARDITIKIKDDQDKLLITEQLRISNERYELASKATNDAIWDWDLKNNVLSRNKEFANISGTGYHGSMLSAPWAEFIHPDDKQQVLNSILAATTDSNEQFWQSEYRFIKADGSVAFITDRGYIVRNSIKEAIRMVGAMHDDTELREKELRILKQNQRIYEIAQFNSHVIRKPVANILGLVDLLDKELILGEGNMEILLLLLTATKDLDAAIQMVNQKTLD